MEAGAFPSDQYAIETLVKHFGLDPDQAIIEISPREGEKLLREEDIIDTIAQAYTLIKMSQPIIILGSFIT